MLENHYLLGRYLVGLDGQLAYGLTFVDIVAASSRLLQPVANLPDYKPHDDQLFLHYDEFCSGFIVKRTFT
jgi:hypothetical protein